MARMYDWTKPRVIIPVHGEARQLEAHLRFAASRGTKTVSAVRNGTMVRLLPSPPQVVDAVPVGRVYRDGELMVASTEPAVRERRKLSAVGAVTVFLVMQKNGELAADPEVVMLGLPENDADGQPLEEVVFSAIDGAFVSIPRARRKDTAMVEEAVRRSVRSAVAAVWGKKTVCTVVATVV
jgi:ribonuclease J